ncbi:phosphatidylserine decarboxylase-domain-containing protein [Protomyces lactucae-debilis]|uniref:Phosphatidylserine decarboxylase proenzyme 1, mitochondrial n=1 Tax=Protomyces lactucae-debilis TaxID=2754530 RepID=A0A1Y2FRJ0_PROLT|nr:phosphatidylserine decarboxylase-domain-containing protein [Protomyces lactucae-debilis]ORY86197.1 phosphatidylserine decarboxylase-domain-containing protein [Protomyces lactucae-debilis]
MAERLHNTKIKWKPIPVALGIAVVGAVFYKKKLAGQYSQDVPGQEKIRPTGPWQVYVLETLPLRSISRLWGRFNEIDLPVFMRVPGYHLYSWIFGCNLDEMKEKDLKQYRNLAHFFYRELEEGCRPIDTSALIVSPADGKVLHFGKIEGRRVEQVKGLSYSLDALLGGEGNGDAQSIAFDAMSDDEVKNQEQFADINGITYSLDDLLTGKKEDSAHRDEEKSDVAVVAADVAMTRADGKHLNPGNSLFFAVVYLAPGDYHRFHSPTNWVVEKRRHFAGELFSVSPYIAKRLANLFVLNERVVLFGRYRHGFFSMTPVGATNVGSIRIAFDKDLKTNTLTKDKPEHGFVEATYKASSKLLGGHPLRAGEEMGGFSLGSTIVLVFEAPSSFKFVVESGQHVNVGEALGKE